MALSQRKERVIAKRTSATERESSMRMSTARIRATKKRTFRAQSQHYKLFYVNGFFLCINGILCALCTQRTRKKNVHKLDLNERKCPFYRCVYLSMDGYLLFLLRSAQTIHAFQCPFTFSSAHRHTVTPTHDRERRFFFVKSRLPPCHLSVITINRSINICLHLFALASTHTHRLKHSNFITISFFFVSFLVFKQKNWYHFWDLCELWSCVPFCLFILWENRNENWFSQGLCDTKRFFFVFFSTLKQQCAVKIWSNGYFFYCENYENDFLTKSSHSRQYVEKIQFLFIFFILTTKLK